MNNADHLVAHRFQKKAPAAPKKAVETPHSATPPAHLPATGLRHAAAIEMLMAGKVATKAPVHQQHQLKKSAGNG